MNLSREQRQDAATLTASIIPILQDVEAATAITALASITAWWIAATRHDPEFDTYLRAFNTNVRTILPYWVAEREESERGERHGH